MLFCEDCRVQKKWRRPATFPFHKHGMDQCEICSKRRDCYQYPALFLKPVTELTAEEIILDRAIQSEYHMKAEGLVIAYASGPQAGGIDHLRTQALKELIVRSNSGVDWYATYEVRLKAQEGYRKADEVKRNQI